MQRLLICLCVCTFVVLPNSLGLASQSDAQVVIENISSDSDLRHLKGADEPSLYITVANPSETKSAKRIKLIIHTPPGISLKRRPSGLYRLKAKEHRTMELHFKVQKDLPAGKYPIRIDALAKNQNQTYPVDIEFHVVGPQYNLRFTFWGGTYWSVSNEIMFKCGIINEGPDIADPFNIIVNFADQKWTGPKVQRLNPGEEMSYGPFRVKMNSHEGALIPIQYNLVSALDSDTKDNVVSATIKSTDEPTQFGFGFDQ